MKTTSDFFGFIALFIIFVGLVAPGMFLLLGLIVHFLVDQGWWAFAWIAGTAALFLLLACLFDYGDSV